MRRLAALVCAVGIALGAVSPALGAIDERALQRELRCITCNTPLDISNAPSAERMKQYIHEKSQAGWSKDRIKNALVAQFGREVLATPPKEGFDLVAWIVPALAVAAGLAAIPFVTRAWARRGGQRPVPAGEDATAEERERLQRELDRLDL